MIEKHENPPNIDDIKQYIPIKTATVYCFGNIIYNPSKIKLRPDIIAHEEIHRKQQEKYTEPGLWWMRYLQDKEFRKEEEREAFKGQYQFVKKLFPSKVVSEFLEEMSEVFSENYNLNLTKHQAKTAIRK